MKEGASAVLTHHTVLARDPDTPEAEIRIKLVTPPRWGHLELHTTTNLSSTSSADFTFTAEDLTANCVFYVNSRHGDGQESVSDVFSLRAYDPEFPSREVTSIHVGIHPINDEIPQVRLIEFFAVPMNGRRVLTPYLFSVSDRDVPRDILQITFPELPRYGELTVYWQHGEQYTIKETSAPIAESYLGMMNLVYLQTGSVRPPARDRFTVSVSDGIHEVKETAQVLIREENHRGPEFRLTKDGGLLLEGTAWRQLASALEIIDPDTLPEDLVINVLRSPKLGRLERIPRQEQIGQPLEEDLIEAALEAYEGSGTEVKVLREGDRFTKRQLETGRI